MAVITTGVIFFLSLAVYFEAPPRSYHPNLKLGPLARRFRFTSEVAAVLRSAPWPCPTLHELCKFLDAWLWLSLLLF